MCPLCDYYGISVTEMGEHLKEKHPECYQEFESDCMKAVGVGRIKI